MLARFDRHPRVSAFSADQVFDIELAADLRPQQSAALVITGGDDTLRRVPLTLRIDTPIEVDYYRHGGILPFVLRQLLAS